MGKQGSTRPTRRRCIMYKNSALLSIGAALVLSLFFVDGGHAFQIDRNQNAGVLMAGNMKGTANLPITQVSNTPNPCGGRTGVTCRKQSPPGSGAMTADGSRYTSQVANTPTPCGGRTGASCRNGSPAGSSEMATDGSGYTMTKSVVGMLFGAGLFALVGFGAGRLRHHHGDHGQHA
jgi:hypothetical protein